jgi:hypothetical protein
MASERFVGAAALATGGVEKLRKKLRNEGKILAGGVLAGRWRS